MHRYRPKVAIVLFVLLSSLCMHAKAGSLYLPLQLSPEIEARIERLFVIANMPIIKRPIPVKRVHKALARVEETHPALASDVRRYLDRYSLQSAVTHLSVSTHYSDGDGTGYVDSNSRGMTHATDYTATGAAYWVLSDQVALNLGGVVSNNAIGEKDEFPEGSFLSVGWDYLQADIGYRSHWWGPFQESDMLLSTQASAMPSLTLSNAEPLPFLDLSYEIFIAQMSESDLIASEAQPETRLTGNPRLFGVHLSIEPVEGFAIGFNRVLQHGGADRDQSINGLYEAFFNVKENENSGLAGNDFGNQQSSITARYTFTGDFPASVYMTYAGEDTSASSDIHLGNSALMLGVHLPKLTENLDLTWESAEWQNGWYINGNYGDGMSNYGALLGHWGAQQQNNDDAVGAKAQSLKLIWDMRPGNSLTFKYQQVENEEIDSDIYTTGKAFSVEYAQGVGNLIAGLKFTTGNTVHDESFSQVSGFIRW